MGGALFPSSRQRPSQMVLYVRRTVSVCRVTVGTRDSRGTESLRPDFTDVVTSVTSDFDSLEWIVGSLVLVSRSRHKFFDSIVRSLFPK